MPQGHHPDLEHFKFRDLHPHIFVGTASDRYVGWIGQIYSDTYGDQITRRPKTFKGKKLIEEVLPVSSVKEYFQHFRTLEIDYTFYSLLLDEEGEPTQNFHVLSQYGSFLNEGDRLILKVPQVVFARKLRRGKGFVPNETYLDPEVFTRRFYEPAVSLLDPYLDGLVFEQEYQRKAECPPPEQGAAELGAFFGSIPKDTRYHVELRTEAFLAGPVFQVLERHGIGQVLSHWTWLPSLRRQFALSGKRFLNAGGSCVLRLMTPKGVRYEDAYLQAHPFNTLVEGMVTPWMIEDTARLMNTAVRRDTRIHIIINNRAGGNAPLLARRIAEAYLSREARGVSPET